MCNLCSMDESLLKVADNNTYSANTSTVWIRINAFLSSRAPNTAITYSSVIKEWCKFLGAEAGSNNAAEKLLSATDLHALAYRAWLEKQPGQKPRMRMKQSDAKSVSKISNKRKKNDGLESTLTNSTIWKKFSALRRMYRVIISADLGLKSNPFDIDMAPAPAKDSGKKRPTEMLDFSLVSQLLALPDLSTPHGRRDAGILAVLFGGGLRRSEVCKLRIGDYRTTRENTPYLYLRATKGRKDYEQAIPAWTADAVNTVISDRKKEGALDGDFLFISYRGRGGSHPTNEPISDSGLYKLFKNYCLLAGAGQYMTPHSARATAITKLLVDGLNHREVQEFSRHSSVQMVEVYDKRRLSVEENPGRKLKF